MLKLKPVFFLLIIMTLASCKTTGNPTDDKSIDEIQSIETSLIIDGKKVVIVKIHEMFEFTLGGKDVDVIVYETDPKIDFIKIIADEHLLGVSAEYAWINYRYPGFRRTMQALVEIEINGTQLPFDILEIENGETKEVKSLYFDISSFYGKW